MAKLCEEIKRLSLTKDIRDQGVKSNPCNSGLLILRDGVCQSLQLASFSLFFLKSCSMPPGLSLSCQPVYFSALQTEPFIVAVALKKSILFSVIYLQKHFVCNCTKLSPR